MVSWWEELLLLIAEVSKGVCCLVPWRCADVRGSAMVGCAISAVRGGIELKLKVDIQLVMSTKMVVSDVRIVWREDMFLGRFGGGNGGINSIPV